MNSSRSRFLPSPGKLLAAVPAIVGATQAHAVIVYTDFGPSGVSAVPDTSSTTLTFNLDGSYDPTGATTYDFSLFVKATAPSDLQIQLTAPNTAIAQLGGSYLFGTGETIGPDSEDGLTFSSSNATVSPALNTPYYIGLEDDGIYGWAEVMLGSGTNITLFGVAYDDSGASIVTGDTGASAIPEPGTSAALAGLAAGAVAAFVARRKRKAKASAVVA